MKRRDFIQLMGLEAFFLTYGPALKAQVRKTPWGHDEWEGFFVTIVMEGAWDVSLSLNPYLLSQRPAESEFFIEYTQDQLLPWGRSALGPAMEPLLSHFKDISVVNGIFMSTNDNGHESLRSYALSGDVSNERANFAQEVVETLPQDQFGVLTETTISTGLRANHSTDFYIAHSSLSGQEDLLADSFVELAQSGILVKVKEAQNNGKKISVASSLFSELSAKYPSPGNPVNAPVIAASSFKAGLSRAAVFRPALDLDSHDNHPNDHMNEQQKGWKYVNEIFNLFKNVEYKAGQSLFDVTTFMVTSEFCRTPALNTAKGKDHNPWTNSALLAGRGIKGEVSVGDSQLVMRAQSKQGIPYLVGLSYDFETQRVIESRNVLTSNSDAILPQNILRTLTEAMGLNAKVIGGNLEKTALLKPLLKG